MRPEGGRRGIRTRTVCPNTKCRASRDIKARTRGAEVTTVADLLPMPKSKTARPTTCRHVLVRIGRGLFFTACLYISWYYYITYWVTCCIQTARRNKISLNKSPHRHQIPKKSRLRRMVLGGAPPDPSHRIYQSGEACLV